MCAGATVTPVDCPPGSYCAAGSAAALPCPAGTYGGKAGLQTVGECAPVAAETDKAVSRERGDFEEDEDIDDY